jgi:hypothetical protein
VVYDVHVGRDLSQGRLRDASRCYASPDMARAAGWGVILPACHACLSRLPWSGRYSRSTLVSTDPRCKSDTSVWA